MQQRVNTDINEARLLANLVLALEFVDDVQVHALRTRHGRIAVQQAREQFQLRVVGRNHANLSRGNPAANQRIDGLSDQRGFDCVVHTRSV